ncbi:MAG: ribosome silencing factor [Phycisphaerales bacterium]|jgi:ribosome-associated protein|nr:ribosome silencing factor [Phycisphaerales bacterium]
MTTTNSDITNRPDSAAFAVEAGRLLQDRHCEDVVLLDVTGLSQVCDYVLIATGTSDRQMKSVAVEVKNLGEEMQLPAFRKNIDSGATWIVVDFVTVVLHMFEPQRRAYYDLEDLWSDAKRVQLPSSSETTTS